MKRFIKAAWHTVNSHPSRSVFTTQNLHLFENIHSALEELRRLGVYKVVYWNCRSERAFHKGEIDFNYTPNKPDEFYINDLTIDIPSHCACYKALLLASALADCLHLAVFVQNVPRPFSSPYSHALLQSHCRCHPQPHQT